MDTSLLHYQLDGSASAPLRLVLMHPVGLDLTFFDSLVEQLGPHYRILRPDLRGHGRSPSLTSASRLEDYAEDVHALLMRIEYVPAIVIGFSFGGMLAQVLALRHPQDVRALVISACASTFSEESRKALVERGERVEHEGMSAVLDSTLKRWFSDHFLNSRECARVRERLLSDDVRSWAGAWLAISQMNTAPHLATIQVPTLCLAGERDRSAPPHVVAAIAEAIPDACFVVIPHAPHMLFIEQPQTVAAAISGFLTSEL